MFIQKLQPASFLIKKHQLPNFKVNFIHKLCTLVGLQKKNRTGRDNDEVLIELTLLPYYNMELV